MTYFLCAGTGGVSDTAELDSEELFSPFDKKYLKIFFLHLYFQI